MHVLRKTGGGIGGKGMERGLGEWYYRETKSSIHLETGNEFTVP